MYCWSVLGCICICVVYGCKPQLQEATLFPTPDLDPAEHGEGGGQVSVNHF